MLASHWQLMMFSSAKVGVLLKWSWAVAFGKDGVTVPRQKCLGKMSETFISRTWSRLSLLALFWLTVDGVSGYGLMWYFCLFVLILIGSVLQTKGVVMRLLKSGLFSK